LLISCYNNGGAVLSGLWLLQASMGDLMIFSIPAVTASYIARKIGH
jgi:hypothetical protein